MRALSHPFEPWFRVSPDPRAGLRLLCIPYAGGGSSVFHSWQRLAAERLQVCPVHLPGRETRHGEPAVSRLADAVNPLADACAGFLDRPYALFGHSMGALIAFELARTLRRRGVPAPVRFFASAACAPDLISQRPPLGHLDDDAFLDRLAHVGVETAQLTARRELRELLLSALRADVALIEHYRYADEPPFDFPITALGGAADQWIRLGELVAWNAHTRGAFTLRMIPGDHLFVRTAGEQVVRVILQSLQSSA
jgi:medium-chain acyl-[acyl-carrier-protein] hydrolase